MSSGEISPGTNVTLSSIVTGLNIHYTTDGSTPTLASPIYTGPIPVNESMTIKAIAHHASWGISRMLSVDYTISVPRAAKPTASPASGAVAFGTMVALTTETEDAVIHYTTDGSTPTVSSSVYSFVYSTPISITGAMTIKAIAVKAGILDSAEMTEAYIVLPQAAAPTAAPAGGAVASGTTVALTTETEDAAIYYTTDGSTPTESSPVYSAPIIITSATTIKAITVKSGMINSTEMTESYTLMSQVATPTASPSGDAVASGTLVALTTETEDTTIHYTTDGSTPTTSSPVYSAPLSITSAMTIKAIAVKVGMIDSAEMTESYTVLPQAAAPTAAPAGSAVSSGTTVALTTVTEDAAIHYTTDGSTPTESSPVYSAPIIITSATTIKAIAVKAGMTNSAVMSASYTIAAPPTGSTPTPSAPTQVQPTDASVLVNGKVEYAGTAITAQKDGRSITTIVIDQQKLEQRLAAVGARAVITISANAAANVVAGELTGQMVKNMESKQAVVEIKTDAATYSLPARQIDIDAVSAAIGSNVNLQEIKVTIEIAEPKSETVKVVNQAASMGNFTLVVPALEFNVRATYNSQTVEVSRFNAYVERTVAIPEGIDPSKITTGVVVEADGTVRHVPTKVIQIDGKYYAKINSLTNSVYSVVWHPLEFSDAANHWAREAVNDMGSRMVVNGFEDGTFKPNEDMTRAEFAAIVVRGLGLKLVKGSASFSDVRANDWYNDAIHTALTYGLIDGFKDGTFQPQDKITREQAMTIIAKAMEISGLKDKLDGRDAVEIAERFQDFDTVAGWAKSGVGETIAAGIVTGRKNDTLDPKSHVTRAEVMVMIRKLLIQSELI
ncbi:MULTISPECIES: chitobiase/beta-hexosaminidase C-terminal domain-containing protein [unclassified Cohnella]|uniref:chitobiase/beta-hexosaminidase C-terminal domain-containing protein n=1 Tax=unclassified Cohnella TaxID=2636738 RepID=UPI001E45C27B|nr:MULTISPECIES: chitobiase/beta-hexosaminidase C-terminal domain-containing protein [unclassified Cohnella]